MSLRDQLVAKGIASKKDATRVDRELKADRKAEQANRKRKSALEAEARAAQEAEAEARLAEAKAARDARQARKDAAERALRVRNVIQGNAVRAGGGQPFWHRSLDGRFLLRIDVSSGVAFQLRCGQAGIAALVLSDGAPTYRVITKGGAHKLRDIAPEHLVFFVDDPSGISAPDLAFLSRRWESSLRAHRFVRSGQEAR